jgi:hypothetical protein
MKMEVKPLLVFPPGWTPFGPYLALPALKGYLENRDVHCDIMDLNVDFFDYLFTPEFMAECYEIVQDKHAELEKRETLTKEERVLYNKYARAILSKNTITNINKAKDTIRSEEYYDLSKAKHTQNILFDALHLVASRYDGITIRFNKIGLKYSSRSTKQVLQALEDPILNPFIQYYERNVIPGLQASGHTFVGISITSESQLIAGVTLAKLIREHCPNVQHITFGGNMMTRLATGWTEPHPFFDIIDTCVMYEGEEGLYQLLKALADDQPLAFVPNLCYVEDGKLVKNSAVTVAVHELAVPNFDGFPMEKYFMPDLVLPLYSAKSCYARCTFCTIPYASHGKYRILEIDQIYEIMNELSQRYNTKYFTFVDETFAPNTMRKVAQALIDNNADFLWYGETRFTKSFTREFCEHIYQGGCRKIQFGLESYDQRVLNMMKKDTKVEWIEPTLVNCFEAGIAVHLFFMIGFPTEERHEALKTIDFSRRMLNLSRYTYNNPHSTRGFGTFGLDKYSGVWMNPEEYGIHIIDPGPEYDLALNLDYDATIGLTAEEAEEVVSLYNQNPYTILNQTDYQSFHESANKLHAEEEPFLRLCLNESTEESMPTFFNVRVRLANRHPDETLSLEDETLAFKMKRDLSRQDLERKENILFYNSKTRRYYQLESRFQPLVDRLLAGELRVGDLQGEPELLEHFEDLLYYDMLLLEGQRSNVQALDVLNSPLHFNKWATAVQTGGKEVVLFNRVTGEIMKMNSLSYGILQLLDGTQTLQELMSTLRSNSIAVDEGLLQRLVKSGLYNGMIHFCEPLVKTRQFV